MKRTMTLSFSLAEFATERQLHMDSVGMMLDRPTKVTKDEYQDTLDKIARVMSFGLFGDSHDGNKFDPEVTGLNIIPKAEDFVDIPYRFISATTVGAGSWKATDFSNVEALKASTAKLDGKPIYPNHSPELYNFLGIVTKPYWDEGGMQNGISVPPGINGTMRIDAKTNSKLVRGMLMGALFSNSVTVTFDWEPSHKFSSEEEFNDAVGSYSKDDGKMVARKVTNIIDYYETSLVWLGADPFAKMIDNAGNLVNIDAGSVVSYSKATEQDKKNYKDEKKYGLGFCIDKNILSLSIERLKKSKPNTKTDNSKEDKSMKKFLVAFIAAFGKSLNLSFGTDVTELTAEQETELVAALSKIGISDPSVDAAKFNTLTSFVTGLQVAGENGTLTALASDAELPTNVALINTTELSRIYSEITRLTPFEKLGSVGQKYLDLKRADCLKHYSLSVDGKTEAETIKLINEADIQLLDTLLKSYTKTNGENMTPFCKHCESGEHIELRSSLGDDGKGGTKETAKVSVSDIRAAYTENNLFGKA